MDDETMADDLGLRPMVVPLSNGSTLSEVGDVLRAAGHAGAVLDHPDDGADHAFVLVLVDGWGEPMRWRTDVGRPRFLPDSTASLLALMRHRFGEGVELAGDEGGQESDRPGLGITSMVWFPFKALENYGGLVAAAVGAPVVVAALGSRHIYSPTAGREGLLDDDLPESHQSILLWRTPTRRGVFIRKRRVRALHWWDERFALIDPSDGRPLTEDGSRVADVVDAIRGDQEEAIADITAAFRLDPTAAERLRILCRRTISDENTFAELVGILDLPSELAELAEGRLDPHLMPDAVVRTPQTIRENLAEDWADIRSIAREPTVRSHSPLDAWQRLTARRPLWYTLLTVVIVGGSAAVAVMRLLDGAGFSAIWIQFAVIVLWTGSYVAPRRRFLHPEQDHTAHPEPGRHETEDTRPH